MSVVDRLVNKIMNNIYEDKSSETTREDIYNALLTMIKWTRQFNQKEEIRGLIKYTTSPLMWAKEYCTIKYCLPRRSGHTEFITKMLDLGKMNGGQHSLFEGPVVIFPNIDIAESSNFSPKWDWVGTPKNLDKFRGRKWGSVIVDCSSVLSKNEIENIYKAFQYHIIIPNFVFIFLE